MTATAPALTDEQRERCRLLARAVDDALSRQAGWGSDDLVALALPALLRMAIADPDGFVPQVAWVLALLDPMLRFIHDGTRPDPTGLDDALGAGVGSAIVERL